MIRWKMGKDFSEILKKNVDDRRKYYLEELYDKEVETIDKPPDSIPEPERVPTLEETRLGQERQRDKQRLISSIGSMSPDTLARTRAVVEMAMDNQARRAADGDDDGNGDNDETAAGDDDEEMAVGD